MILKYLLNTFKHIVFYDSEYRQNIKEKGERPHVVCIVYKDYVTGKIHRAYGADINKHPYPINETLFIAFNFVAEASSMLALKMDLPKFAYDCYIENKKLYWNRVPNSKGAMGQLRTAARYKYENNMSGTLKDFHRDEVIYNKTYTDEQMQSILDYCERDVLTLEHIFINQLKDIEANYPNYGPKTFISQANFHARSMICAAKVEDNGMHIDNELFDQFTNQYERIKNEMIEEINSKIDVYNEHTFSNKKFENFIKKLGLWDRWPKTETGKLKTTDKVLHTFAQEHKDVDEFYLCKEFADSNKLKGAVVGPDGKARTSLNLFGTVTGRTNPSTATYPFNAPRFFRNILKPKPGHLYLYADYAMQEPCIAAYLSGDENMIEAYNSDDMYLYAPIKAGLLPQDAATEYVKSGKVKHAVERELYKRSLLASMYGQMEYSLSKTLNIPLDHAAKLLVDITNSYERYFKWVAQKVSRGLRDGYMKTKFGWRRNVAYGEKINKRSLFNFMCQGHGSEMLRFALISLTDKKFEVNALVHDGILLHIKDQNVDKKILQVRKLMTDAAKIVLGKHCKMRVDIKEIRGNFKQDEKEQKKFERIFSKVKRSSVPKIGQVCTQNTTPGQSSYMYS